MHCFRAVINAENGVFLPNLHPLQVSNPMCLESLDDRLKQSNRRPAKKSPIFLRNIPAKIGIARKYHCNPCLPD